MVKCLVCGKEFENGFGPEICPVCLGDEQSEHEQQFIPEEYKSHYSGVFGECDYDTRMFKVFKGFKFNPNIKFLCYKHNCGLQPYIPEGYTSCCGMFKGCKLPKGFTLGDTIFIKEDWPSMNNKLSFAFATLASLCFVGGIVILRVS